MVVIVEQRFPYFGTFTPLPKLLSRTATNTLEGLGSGDENVKVSLQNFSQCDLEPQNPWCGLFGIQQYIEIVYLSIITVFGVLGNLVVISSILLERKLHKQANIFIVNLAVADFLAAGLYTPVVIANVIESRSALSLTSCQIFGYIIIVACSSSMWNLAFIAINRYIAITYNEWFQNFFSKKKTYFLVVFAWVISILLASPTLYGWTNLHYDYKSMVCAWDDTASLSFTIFLISGAIFIPLCATIFCYWKLFTFVLLRNRQSIKIIANSRSQADADMRKKTLQKEISLLRTLATTLIVFVLFWTPYAFCSLINPQTVPALIKKIATWFGLNNSAVNFIIYGVMNEGYREGYKKLFTVLFCKRNANLRRHSSAFNIYQNRSRMVSVTASSVGNADFFNGTIKQKAFPEPMSSCSLSKSNTKITF